jgi:hypothetical protein
MTLWEIFLCKESIVRIEKSRKRFSVTEFVKSLIFLDFYVDSESKEELSRFLRTNRFLEIGNPPPNRVVQKNFSQKFAQKIAKLPFLGYPVKFHIKYVK